MRSLRLFFSQGCPAADITNERPGLRRSRRVQKLGGFPDPEPHSSLSSKGSRAWADSTDGCLVSFPGGFSQSSTHTQRRSDEACTSGQLVVASRESQYKVFHFHHGGLDKLSDVFQQWKYCTEMQLKDQQVA
ncbi:TBC1D16 isoform 9, partial [Pongo abelii]